MSKREHSKNEAAQRMKAARRHLWRRMLEALSQTRGLGGVDALDKDGRDALEAELSEHVNQLEELDVENTLGLPTHSELRKLWRQYHELGEQIRDIRDTGTTLENHDPDAGSSITKSQAIEEVEKTIAILNQLIEDAEDAGVSREKLDEIIGRVWKKMFQYKA